MFQGRKLFGMILVARSGYKIHIYDEIVVNLLTLNQVSCRIHVCSCLIVTLSFCISSLLIKDGSFALLNPNLYIN